MSKKFTEEQYHKIIKAWRSRNTYGNKTDAVIDCLIDDLNLDAMLMGEKALAIANQLTREWAHEQFFEKEKRYVWTSKEGVYNDFYKRLYMHANGYICEVIINQKEFSMPNKIDHLTEQEVRDFGYNPEMFDKEEVD